MDRKIYLILFFVLALNGFLYAEILAGKEEGAAVYFLDVGQGDAEMMSLTSGGREARILVDGGPDRSVLTELDKVLPFLSRRIDLISVSHTEKDHVGGIPFVMENFRTGIFVYNGEIGEGEVARNLDGVLKKSGTEALVLKKGDKIKYGESEISFLNPEELSGTKNKDSLVFLLKSGNFSAFFTGDIDQATEEKIIKENELKGVDILKVAHHGSKTSSGNDFIRELNPKASVIEVGKNSYGHPTSEVLNRLASVGSLIFRTDEKGTMKVEKGSNGKLRIYEVR